MHKIYISPALISVLALSVILGLGAPAWAAPKVVASILPVHSLVAGVMQGVGEPRLLLPGTASPHAYAMRPSDARALHKADLVFWIGPGLEKFLAKPLLALAGRARIAQLSDLPGIRHGELAENDMHLWLDPYNAEVIARQVIKSLGELDRANAAAYSANGSALLRRLQAASRRIEDQLSNVKKRPFVVLHDAYRHFTSRFGLAQSGALAVNAELPPGAKRLRAIKRLIRENNVVCVFGERRAQLTHLTIVAEGTSARTGRLDALGLDLAPGPDAYFNLLARLSSEFSRCLGGRE